MFCYIKIHWYVWNFEWAFYPFCIITHGSSGKNWPTELYKYCKCQQLSWYHIKKSYLLKSPIISLGKSLNIGKPWSSDRRYKFSKILIFSWKFELYHGEQILSIFPLTDRLSLFLLKKMSIANTQVCITMVCQSLSQMKMVFHGKRG